MANKTNLSISAVILVLVAAYFGIDLKQQNTETAPPNPAQTQSTLENHDKNDRNERESDSKKNTKASIDNTAQIAQAFREQQSDLQVKASGEVIAVLKDDNEGSRHQKFLLKLSNGQTVLVAHNIDLSPRIENIQKGDRVEFYGEYEYSEKGGVIHWTHHDPRQKHIDGWLKHQGKTYQ